MNLQIWVSTGSLVAVVVGIISLVLTIRKDRDERNKYRDERAAEEKKTRDQQQRDRDAEIETRAKQWAYLNKDITEMKGKISDIEHTIGNGFAGSIKVQIHDLQLNCTGKMSALTNQVFAVNTPQIKDIEHRVNDIEKGK
jgi:hypothetical protein